jgi:sulfate permease, SulP family
MDRITIALSLTAADEGLLRYAAQLLVWRPLAMCFVHVVTDARQHDYPSEQETHRRLEEIVRSHFHPQPESVQATFHVVPGHSRLDALLNHAVEQHSNLIVLGHHKSSRGNRALARRLAMVTPCSVWMVPEGSPPSISRILAPTDFSEHSADSLGAAASIARQLGLAECHALHVYFDPSTIRYDEHIAEVRGQEQQAFAEFMRPIDTQGVDVIPHFDDSANTAAAILRTAEAQQADLIVMGTRGRSRAAAVLLGSVTSEVLSSAQIPVLAIKHFGPQLRFFEALRDERLWRRPNPKMN